MRLNERGKNTILIIIALSVVLTIVGTLLFRNDHTAEIKKGRAYLSSLAKQNVSTIESKVKAQDNKQAVQEMNKDLLAAYKDNSKVWPLFKDYVILGDSRAVDFNEFLSARYVLAEKNKTINDINTKLTKVKALSPSRIIIAYGLNDVSIPRWKNVNTYIKDFEVILKKVHKACPNATIYINSILPVVKYPEEVYRHLGTYNTAIAKMCRKDGYVYINNTYVANSHKDLYEEDGQHLKESFYKYWGYNIMKTIYAHEKSAS
jgi:hypothetical protein